MCLSTLHPINPRSNTVYHIFLPETDPTQIVDFVITVLFNRNGSVYRKPQHLLTHGYQRATGFAPLGNNNAPACSIPGLVARFPNQNVVALKQAPWTDVLGLLGCNGDEIMLRLLLDCGVFVSIDTWKGIYNQVSGMLIWIHTVEMPLLTRNQASRCLTSTL